MDRRQWQAAPAILQFDAAPRRDSTLGTGANTTNRKTLALSLVLLLAGCTDGATRIANDIQAGTEDFRHSDKQVEVIRHVPKESPDGCGDAYDVQFSKDSSLVIWCKDSKTGETTSSHTTTYHLNFVKVPVSYRLLKNRGEPLLIELSKQNGDIVVSDVR
ncbi:MAG: hypothetical protein QM719_06620 [Thermomonas sp.]